MDYLTYTEKLNYLLEMIEKGRLTSINGSYVGLMTEKGADVILEGGKPDEKSHEAAKGRGR